MDEVSFLYHSMSKTSDVMVVRDEDNAAENVALGIRATVAPADRPMPSYMRRRSTHGRFAVYESSPEGYFGLVDIGGYYTGPQSTTYEPSAAWLKDRLLTWGIVLALDSKTPIGPAVARWQALPQPAPQYMTPRGRILTESKIGETYRAQVEMVRPAYAFVKITWHPYLVATVDGHQAPLIQVTPGFGAVAVPAGVHEVAVAYRPGPLKMILVFLGVALFGGLCVAMRGGRWARAEASIAQRLAKIGERFTTPRATVAAVLILGALVALHPLFRGKLISGHDSTVYPPRLVEFAKVLKDFQLPPIWAPDLGAGHGQPLFEFAPPFVYLSALPFHALGMGLTDSYQFGLALLHLLGLIAFYRLARKFAFSRTVSAAGAMAWLFAPYLTLDLFVRGAFAEACGCRHTAYRVTGPGRGHGASQRGPGCGGCHSDHTADAGAQWDGAAGYPGFGPYGSTARCCDLAARETEEGRATHRAFHCGRGKYSLRTCVIRLLLAAGTHRKKLCTHRAVAARSICTGETIWSGPDNCCGRPGDTAFLVPGLKSGMSFALGPVHLALAILGLIVVLRSRDRKLRAYAIAFGLAAILGAWLSTTWASAVWQHVATLQYMGFPWRTLVLPGLMMPVLALFAFDRLGAKWTVAAVLLLIGFNLPHTEPVGYLTYDDEYYAPESIAT